MVGSTLIRRLVQEECRILTVGRDAVDLSDQAAVDRWFEERRRASMPPASSNPVDPSP
jgi:GDP-L-fucose synthase